MKKSCGVGIFDRIIHKTDKFSTDEICECIRRDLENLMNAMQGISDLPPYYQELSSSLAVYGLSGFNAANLESHAERSRLLESIKKTILKFEPRLEQVQIEDLGIVHPFILQFGIKAVLKTSSETVPIQFGTTINKYGSAEIKK